MVDIITHCYATGEIAAAKQLAAAGALLSLEGMNEPNNFPTAYNGVTGGGSQSWMPIAHLVSVEAIKQLMFMM